MPLKVFLSDAPLCQHFSLSSYVGFIFYLLLSNFGLNTLLMVLLAIYLSAYVISLVLQHYLIRKS